ncbi:MAG: UDP-N-acetylmuramoyl-tripeptide--D-alanyl-D-alanine ligase [Bacteroidota bacterium]
MSIESLYQIYLRHPKVTTDSRQVEPGCLFFALKGEHFNGNEFAAQAIEQGAAFAIIDEPQLIPHPSSLIPVDDVLSTLQKLATHHRRHFDIPLIAITGTNGKTTTKELLSAVLASHYPAHFTKGNLNNHIGVPLTLLAMPAETEVAIIEMGANKPGDIDELCRIAEPTHGLITNVGKAHLEGFGDFEGVKQTKAELYRYLAAHKGLIFINLDEPHLEKLAEKNRLKVYYHQSQNPDREHHPYEVKFIAGQPFVVAGFLSETDDLVEVKTHLIGAYNFNNVMSAIALGRYFKVPAQKIKAAIEGYVPANNRSQILKIGSNTFVLDAYNANPTSMKHALTFFAEMDASRKIAILGAMKELGSFSDVEHEQMAEFALSCPLRQVILVGNEFREAAENAGIQWFETTAQLKDWFGRQSFSDTHFLVKGSRSIGLEKLLDS